MTIAALYDIHGNLPALEAVLDEVRRAGIDHIMVGGDVLPGPMPRECLSVLRQLDIPTQFIRGNGDRLVLAARAGQDITEEAPEAAREVVRWSAAQVDDDICQWMSTWPATRRLHVPAIGEVLFCHATPRNDTDIFTRSTRVELLLPLFEPANAALVVCGHTHMQFDRRVGGTRVINAGSVGMPFGEAGAYWLEISDEPHMRRTRYDLRAAAARILASDYPQAESFASTNILRPPDESTMLATFDKVPLAGVGRTQEERVE